MERVDELVETLKTATGAELEAALSELAGYGAAASRAAVHLLHLAHNSPDRRVRWQALEAVCAIDPVYAGATVTAAETGVAVREAAAYAASLSGDEVRRAVDNLLWGMGDAPAADHDYAVVGVPPAEIAAAVPEVIPDLARALVEKPGHRPTVSYALQRVADRHPAAVCDVVRPLLVAADPALREAAFEVAGSATLPPDFLPAALAAFRRDRGYCGVPAFLLAAIAASHPQPVVAALVAEVLADPTFDLARDAARALDGPDMTAGVAREALRYLDHGDRLVRYFAVSTLASSSWHYRADRDLVDAVLEGFRARARDPFPSVREVAGYAAADLEKVLGRRWPQSTPGGVNPNNAIKPSRGTTQ